MLNKRAGCVDWRGVQSVFSHFSNTLLDHDTMAKRNRVNSRTLNIQWIREAANKVIFLVESPLRILAPPPRLGGQKNEYKKKKKLFSLVDNPFTPTPSLSGLFFP